MTVINQAQFEMLISLQKIEFDRIEVQKSLDAVAAKVDDLEKELQAQRDAIDKENQALQAEKAAYADFEEQIQTNDTLVAKIEAKRRSVKTEREYQMLLKEEEQLRARKSQIEEDMLVSMDKMETLTQTIADQEAALEQIRPQVENDIQTVRQEASASETRRADLSRKWKQMAADIDAKLLAKFVKVKEQTADGRALAPAKNAICMACHMNIPPQMFNELQRFDSLKLCPFCFRILYWDNS